MGVQEQVSDQAGEEEINESQAWNHDLHAESIDPLTITWSAAMNKARRAEGGLEGLFSSQLSSAELA